MPKSANQKLKALYLMDLLLSETDEEKGLTMSEMLARLAAMGIKAERKSIYDDLEALRSDLDSVDEECVRCELSYKDLCCLM